VKLFTDLAHDRLYGYAPLIFDIHSQLIEVLSWDALAVALKDKWRSVSELSGAIAKCG